MQARINILVAILFFCFTPQKSFGEVDCERFFTAVSQSKNDINDLFLPSLQFFMQNPEAEIRLELPAQLKRILMNRYNTRTKLFGLVTRVLHQFDQTGFYNPRLKITDWDEYGSTVFTQRHWQNIFESTDATLANRNWTLIAILQADLLLFGGDPKNYHPIFENWMAFMRFTIFDLSPFFANAADVVTLQQAWISALRAEQQFIKETREHAISLPRITDRQPVELKIVATKPPKPTNHKSESPPTTQLRSPPPPSLNPQQQRALGRLRTFTPTYTDDDDTEPGQ